MEVSRRSFLKGSLAAGALSAAGFALGGCSPQEGAQSSGGQAAESQGMWSWSVPPEPIADDAVAQTYDCDICVIGAGNAGNVAALYAATHGARVVVLQKEATTCNNGASTGYWKDWKKEGSEAAAAGGGGLSLSVNTAAVPQQEWEISTVLQSLADLGEGVTNLALIRRHVLASSDAINWMVETVPEPKPVFSNSTTLSPNRIFWVAEEDSSDTKRIISNPNVFGNWQFNVNCAEKAQENGATYLFSTPAVQLVTDDAGAVVGAIGQASDDSYVKVNASKGVILCCGDISADEEMLQCYCPEAVGLTALGVMSSCTGDGTKMGLWVGAALEETPSNVQFHLDLLDPQPFKGVPWLTVNINAERFTNENQDYGDITNAYVMQPEHTVFQITDSHLLDHISEYKHAFYPTNSMDDVEKSIEEGTGFRADTIEELAEAAGLDARTLKETVDRYNAMVDAGDDTDFGVAPEILKLNGIKEPPFYAFKYLSGLIMACAGLKSNEYMQVISEKTNEPIPGLYAAGNAQGCFFREGYDHELGGWTLGRAKVGGILAVKSAMGTLDEAI